MKTKIEDLTPEQINRLLVIAQDTLSLNNKVTIDSEEELVDFVEDTVPGPEELCIKEEQDARLREYVHKFLTPKEEQVIKLRYGLGGQPPKTLHEVGKIMGLTRERIRQIEQKGLDRLRTKLRRINVTSKGDL